MRALRIWRVTRVAVKSLRQHKLRAGLTVLGIVFGVSSVVAMLSVGEGASQEIQEQLQQLGNCNILISSLKLPMEQYSGGQANNTSYIAKYGITYDDVGMMAQCVPGLRSITPMKVFKENVQFSDRSVETGLVATVPSYAKATNHMILAGRFINQADMITGEPICVIGARLARTIFAGHDPINQFVRVGQFNDVFKVVGVIGDVYSSKNLINTPLWFVGENEDVYIPLKTYTRKAGDFYYKRDEGTRTFENVEIYKLIITIDTQDNVMKAASMVTEVLRKNHKREDYEIVVPLQLIRRSEETKRLFNIVLGSIAAISLIVGGIGIMNIMLATVSERTREIGIRRALGAQQGDIVVQFLAETLLLSVLGGVAGLLVGAAIPKAITFFTQVRTVLTPFSFIVAFTVSVGVGLTFGIYPARRAARMDPIEALRHE